MVSSPRGDFSSRSPDARIAETKASGAVELAFLGDALEGLAGALDAVLVVVAVRGQQLDDGVAARGGRAAEARRRIVNDLAHPVFVRIHRYIGRDRLHRRADGADHR